MQSYGQLFCNYSHSSLPHCELSLQKASVEGRRPRASGPLVGKKPSIRVQFVSADTQALTSEWQKMCKQKGHSHLENRPKNAVFARFFQTKNAVFRSVKRLFPTRNTACYGREKAFCDFQRRNRGLSAPTSFLFHPFPRVVFFDQKILQKPCSQSEFRVTARR